MSGVGGRVLIGALLGEIADEQRRIAETCAVVGGAPGPVVLDAVELVRLASEVADHAALLAREVTPKHRTNTRQGISRLAAAALQTMAVLDYGSGLPELPAESGESSEAERADVERYGPDSPAAQAHREHRDDVVVFWRAVARVRLRGQEVVRPGAWQRKLEEPQATVDEARRRFRPEDLVDVWLERRLVVATAPCRVDLEAEAVVPSEETSA